MKLNIWKSIFVWLRVSVLDHSIDDSRVRVDPDEILAIYEMQAPYKRFI